MAEYHLSGQAELDLAEIAEFTIERFGVKQARTYRDGLKACFVRLAENSRIGRPAEHLAPNLRRFGHQSHVVFYQPNPDGMLIVRVLHSRMDAARFF